jgi:cell division protein FtsN
MSSLTVQPASVGKNAFTVQVGSYQGRDAAERERAKLVKKGFAPLMLQKGAYTVVCVGSFGDKETAKPLLTKLRQNYRDCYIRRL